MGEVYQNVSDRLELNEAMMKKAFNYPENEDAIFHGFVGCGVNMLALFIDGMTDIKTLGDFLLRPSFRAGVIPESADKFEYIATRVSEVAQVSGESLADKIAALVLNGMTALFIDGCDKALMLDTRGFERRTVDKTRNESVVMGSQEGFVENLRTNITLMHRYYQSADFIAEKTSVGTRTPLKIALLYVKGVTNEKALEEARRRIKLIDKETVFGAGELQQLIEDDKWAVFPQMLMTERPDRTAAALADGQFAILADCSPYALIAPCTMISLMQTSDDAFSRWQYGSYMRVIRFAGFLLAMLLPGLYVALTMYHTHLIPMSLLTAIAESRANVPFPIIVEVVIMELSFTLINEANMRIPSQVGPAIGIIGALVLGQAAVDASIISPILIIIIALTGLGCYAMPNYPFSIGVILYRLLIVLAGALIGLFGVALALFAIACQLSSLKSFGVEYLMPIAPWRSHNPDLLIRGPAQYQNIRRPYSRKGGRA